MLTIKSVRFFQAQDFAKPCHYHHPAFKSVVIISHVIHKVMQELTQGMGRRQGYKVGKGHTMTILFTHHHHPNLMHPDALFPSSLKKTQSQLLSPWLLVDNLGSHCLFHKKFKRTSQKHSLILSLNKITMVITLHEQLDACCEDVQAIDNTFNYNL